MSHHNVDYASLIREKGFRLTWQREAILDAICESRRHVSVDEISALLAERAPGIDPSTLYRSLDFLSKLHLITVSLIDGERMYEIAVGQEGHHHLVCRICDEEIEIPDRDIRKLAGKIEEEYGFILEADHLMLSGICAACQQRIEKENLTEKEG